MRPGQEREDVANLPDGDILHDGCVAPDSAEGFVRPVAGQFAVEGSPEDPRLIEAEQRYQSIVLAMSEGVVFHSEDGRIISANPAAERILGQTAEQLSGRTSAEVAEQAGTINVDGTPFLGDRHPAMETLRTGKPLTDVEMGVYRPDGTLVWISISTRALTTPDRTRPYAVVATFRDITDRKRAEAGRQGQASIINGLAVPAFSLDRDMRFTAFSHAFQVMYDADFHTYPKMGVSFLDAIHDPEQRAQTEAEFKRVLAGETVTRQGVLDGAPGDRCWDITRSPIWVEGAVEGIASFARDTTEIRSLARALSSTAVELERSNRDLENLARVASHDLREPLRMVIGYLDLLKKRYQGQLDADADDFIGFAVDGAKRMSHLIEDVLDYSHVGPNGSSSGMTDLGTVMADTLKSMEPAMAEVGAKVTCGPLPTVYCEPVQMGRVFQNLLANSLKFRSDSDPVIEVTARRAGDMWEFRFADNGIGIDPEDFERVFLMFQRLPATVVRPGNGIGLAVSRRIVEGHGGRMWVESQPGEGSTFCFTLPATRGAIR